MSAARNLAGLGNQNTFAVESVANEVGIASTAPSSTLDVRGEVKVGTNIQLGSAGVVTATSYTGSFPIVDASSLAVSGISTLVRLAVTDEVVTGIITALGLSGNLTGAAATISGALNVDGTTDSTSVTTGALIVDGGVGIAKNVYIGAGLSVAGTLTYEDVTNVDSVGLITAKSGVNVSGGQLQVGVAYSVGAAGVATAAGFVGGTIAGSTGTFTGDVDIADKIVHTGDTNTAIRFPAADTVSVETGGTEAIRVDSGGRLLIKETSVAGSAPLCVGNGGQELFEFTPGSATYNGGLLEYIHRSDGNTRPDLNMYVAGAGAFKVYTSGANERLRISSSGRLGIGTNNPASLVDVSANDTTVWPFTVDVSNAYAYSPYPHELQIQNHARDTTGAFAGIYFHSGASADGSYISAARIAAIDSGNYKSDLAFGTRDTNFKERLRIAADGKIGIGTDIPAVEFHVYDSDSLLVSIFESVTHDSRVRIKAPSTKYSQIEFADGDADTGEIRYDHTDDSMQFLVNANVERLRITSTGGLSLNNGELVERSNITAGKLSANQDIDLADGMIHYFTTQETTTALPNIRVDGSTTLNSVMDAGDVVSVTLITTAAAAGYSAHVTIDGVAVTEEWVGGSAPSAGGSDGLDIYCYTIICTHATNTGDSGFKVIANLTNAT